MIGIHRFTSCTGACTLGVVAIDLNYVRTGPRGGVPVVLLHPVGLDLTYWGAVIAALRPDYDVVACDLPGHGASPGTGEDWTLPRATEAVRAFVRGLGADGVHLVGLSVGGMLAQSLALTDPAVVRSLTLIDTAAAFSDEGRAGMRARAATARSSGMQGVLASTIERWFTAQTAAERPDLIDRVSKTLLADDPLTHAAMWDMISELDLLDGLRHIDCPTLVLVGEHDQSSPVPAARQLRDGIARASLAVVANAAHLSPLERPDVVNAHLTDFLGRTW